VDSVETPVGKIPRVSSSLKWKDQAGAWKVRWGFGRMRYPIDPGLYALGNPDRTSPVLVTANYKLTFDRLRQALPNRSFWILALDTKGINVWCAAGKGTFGTEELVGRIRGSGLERVVDHRELILPQLGAPGVAAHLVKKLSGFKVIYGPILAKDLPAFMEAGKKATPEMRRKAFTAWERAVLIPIELVHVLKPLVILLPALFLLGGFAGGGSFWQNAMTHGTFAMAALLLALFMGAVLTPLLLPYLPGRAFALKGFFLSILGVIFLLVLFGGGGMNWAGILERLAWVLLVPALSAYLAMNFTGASTYTSLSGVKKEMRWALPLEIGGAALGLVFWLGALFYF
jgi:acetyl-CoA decarbonylase/synthase complex subunit gamma